VSTTFGGILKPPPQKPGKAHKMLTHVSSVSDTVESINFGLSPDESFLKFVHR
jgi:hypothetical protein